MGPRSGPGSEGSKGSKGSEGVVLPDGNEYEDSVTGFTLVTPVVHADEPEPPSLGRGVAPQATEDRSVRSFQNLSDLSSGLRPAPFRSGNQKEGPFMGRPRANFARLGNPMQDCHLRKEPYVTGFTFVSPVLHAEEPEPPSTGRGWRC